MNWLDKIFTWCYPLMKKIGLDDTIASYSSMVINIIILAILSYFIYTLFRVILVTIIAVIAKKTKTRFDDLLVNSKTAKYLSHLIPLLFIYKSVPVILKDFVYWETIFAKMLGIYITLLCIWIFKTLLNALKNYARTIPQFSDKPLDGYVQVLMVTLWFFGITYIVLNLFGVTFNHLIVTFGAISALIILIFRDTILGFVASVQVSFNDMVRIGDWITVDKFGADGEVIEINLSTIRIKNFDNTTSTIPTHSLLSDSFKNWRGMMASDGRRIKRHILIKAGSIRFFNDAEIEELKKIQLIENYINHRQQDIIKFNSNNNINKSLLVNGRNMTNFGLFRKYVQTYLERHPGINKNMPLLCRQLQPTSQGVPIEIYAFCSDKRFENYEYIMADIFDHILASVIYFDLETFEMPSGKSSLLE